MGDELSIWLPLGFDQWPPLLQAGTLFLLTFVSEDLTTVSAAFLTAAGQLGLPAGFLGCYLGIWMGDAGLYWLARWAGHPLLNRHWARKFFKPAAVGRCEQWFSRKGGWVLISSRFVPGMRLPSYLAAGFLRYPFGRFLLITGAVGLIWTALIFVLASLVGMKLLAWLENWHLGGWAVLAGIALMFVLIRYGGGLFDRATRRGWCAAWGRWMRWEFWPPWLFYPPVVLWCCWLGLKYRGLTLPTTANPCIFTGGIVGESKHAMLSVLSATSPEFTAEARRIDAESGEDRERQLMEACAELEIEPPFIIKPDIGQRGDGVKLVRSWEQAGDCVRQTRAPLVVQRYAEGPHEAGLFYHRFPDEERGRLFAITDKVFPELVGDGVSTVEELIWRDERARYMAAKYLERMGARRLTVPAAGERLRLVEAGNHAQGCIFRDGWRLHSPELEARIDSISRKVEGFFFGRYDVRYRSEEELRAGSGFLIIELNGAASEATNIYDAGNSLASAYGTLFRQWELAYAIGAANRKLGVKPTPPGVVWRAWREYKRAAAGYPVTD